MIIKTITESLHDKYVSGEITLRQAAEKLCECGWDSLSQSIRDIIESGFDISTTTLPSNRLHKPGGMYDKK